MRKLYGGRQVVDLIRQTGDVCGAENEKPCKWKSGVGGMCEENKLGLEVNV